MRVMGGSEKAFVIATRGSALALAQANCVLEQCRMALPEVDFALRVIKTTGDRLQAESSAEVDLPKGLFTKELEVALLYGEADLAVHSLKDLPTDLPEGLELGAITARADARDVFIHKESASTASGLDQLPAGFVIGTSSPRRKAQLLRANPRLEVVAIRGNVPTRLRKLAEQPELGGLVLALAGLTRLGYSVERTLRGPDVPAGLCARILPLETMLPCVGQGALGIEIRAGDERARRICASLDDPTTSLSASAERAFLRAMGGGCQTPVAAYAELLGDSLRMRAVSFESGAGRYVDRTASRADPEGFGQQVAAELCRQ